MEELKDIKTLEQEIDAFYKKESVVDMAGKVLDRWDRRGNELMLSPNKRFAAYIFNRVYETWGDDFDNASDYNGVVIEDRLTGENTERRVYEIFASSSWGIKESSKITELLSLNDEGELKYKTKDNEEHSKKIKV